MKKLVMGIIIGVLLSSSVAFGASIIKNSYFNPELKFVVNNNEVQNIQIVTVEVEGEKYGRNYYSIADVIKALNEYGGINAELSYNAETKTTTLNIQQEEVISKMSIMSVENESEEIMEETNEVVTQTPDGLPVFEYEGEYYIRWSKLRAKCESIGLLFDTNDNNFNFKNKDDTLICSIPLYTIYSAKDSAKYNDYINTVLPLIGAN